MKSVAFCSSHCALSQVWSLWVFTMWIWARGHCRGRTLETVHSFSCFSKAKVEFLTWPTFSINILINLRNKSEIQYKLLCKQCLFLSTMWQTYTRLTYTNQHPLMHVHVTVDLCWSPQNVSSNSSPFLHLPPTPYDWIQTGAKLSQQLLHPLQTRPVFLELSVGKASASNGGSPGTCMRGIQEKKGWESQSGKRRIGREREWGEIPPVHDNEETIQLASLYGPWCWLLQTGQQVPSFYWLKPRGAQQWDTWRYWSDSPGFLISVS